MVDYFYHDPASDNPMTGVLLHVHKEPIFKELKILRSDEKYSEWDWYRYGYTDYNHHLEDHFTSIPPTNRNLTLIIPAASTYDITENSFQELLEGLMKDETAKSLFEQFDTYSLIFMGMSSRDISYFIPPANHLISIFPKDGLSKPSVSDQEGSGTVLGMAHTFLKWRRKIVEDDPGAGYFSQSHLVIDMVIAFAEVSQWAPIIVVRFSLEGKEERGFRNVEATRTEAYFGVDCCEDNIGDDKKLQVTGTLTVNIHGDSWLSIVVLLDHQLSLSGHFNVKSWSCLPRECIRDFYSFVTFI